MARLPKRITYGIVALNDWQIPRRYQIPIITAYLQPRYIPARVNRKRSASVSVGIQIRTERRENIRALVILTGRIYNFICGLCSIKQSVDMKMGEIG